MCVLCSVCPGGVAVVPDSGSSGPQVADRLFWAQYSTGAVISSLAIVATAKVLFAQDRDVEFSCSARLCGRGTQLPCPSLSASLGPTLTLAPLPRLPDAQHPRPPKTLVPKKAPTRRTRYRRPGQRSLPCPSASAVLEKASCIAPPSQTCGVLRSSVQRRPAVGVLLQAAGGGAAVRQARGSADSAYTDKSLSEEPSRGCCAPAGCNTNTVSARWHGAVCS